MTRRDWTVTEERAFVALAPLGTAYLSVLFDRSPLAIRSKANRLRVSVRRTSQIDATTLQLAVEIARAKALGLICPACGVRFATVHATGTCEVCHKSALTDAHDMRAAAASAQRSYDAAKQRSSRAVRALGRKEGRAPKK